MEQMSIYDFIKPPEAWKCYETCTNYGETMGHFPTGEPRCEYGYSQNESPITQEVDEYQEVHFYCKYYKFGKKIRG